MVFSFLSALWCFVSPVSSDPRGRVLAAGPVWAGCGFWDWSWPVVLGVTSNHLPRDQLQEPVLWPVTALAHERAIWDRCYPGRHRGDHWLEQTSFQILCLPCFTYLTFLMLHISGQLLYLCFQVWPARQGRLIRRMKCCGAIGFCLSCPWRRDFSEWTTLSSTTPLKSLHLPTVWKNKRRSPCWHHQTHCRLHRPPPPLCWVAVAEVVAGKGFCQQTVQTT